jgi:hypothetical protein
MNLLPSKTVPKNTFFSPNHQIDESKSLYASLDWIQSPFDLLRPCTDQGSDLDGVNIGDTNPPKLDDSARQTTTLSILSHIESKMSYRKQYKGVRKDQNGDNTVVGVNEKIDLKNEQKNQQKNRNNEYLSTHDLCAASSSSDEDDHNVVIVNIPLKKPKLVPHSARSINKTDKTVEKNQNINKKNPVELPILDTKKKTDFSDLNGIIQTENIGGVANNDQENETKAFSLKSLMKNGTKKSTLSSKSSSLMKNNANNSIGIDVDTIDLVKLDGAKKKDKKNIDDLFSRFG